MVRSNESLMTNLHNAARRRDTMFDPGAGVNLETREMRRGPRFSYYRQYPLVHQKWNKYRLPLVSR
jgi:hypothetical protein